MKRFIEDVAILLGKPLDSTVITPIVGVAAQEPPDDNDPGHPEDERHGFVVPSLGLEFLAGPDRIIRTIFFELVADKNVAGFPWSLKSGLDGSSSRLNVRATLGAPEAEGKGMHIIKSLPPTGPWDRFQFPPFGYLHVQYHVADDGIAKLTLMDQSAVPR